MHYIIKTPSFYVPSLIQYMHTESLLYTINYSKLMKCRNEGSCADPQERLLIRKGMGILTTLNTEM